MLSPDVVLRAVPDEYKEKLAVGLVKIVGNLILPTSGPNRILGHLQPTGLADAATSLMSAASAGSVAGPGGALASAIVEVANVAGNVYNGYQTSKLRAAIDAMKTMQLAGVALSGIGIGVSLAGFAVIAHKLGRIEGRLSTMEGKLDVILHRLDKRDRIDRAREFERLGTTVERVDHAWGRSDAERIWHEEERELHQLQKNFLMLARMSLDDPDGLEIAEPLIEAAAVAGSTRTTALMASGEMEPAIRQSEELATALVKMTTPVGAAALLAQRVKLRPGNQGYADAMADARGIAEADAASFRAREDMAQATPLTIKRLQFLGIEGREWLQVGRDEKNEPFLMLTGGAA